MQASELRPGFPLINELNTIEREVSSSDELRSQLSTKWALRFDRLYAPLLVTRAPGGLQEQAEKPADLHR